MTDSSTPPAPRAAQHPTIRSFHGDVLNDPYEWLRDKESPQVLAHLNAENAYTQSRLAHLDGLRSRIFREIKAHTQETDLSVPVRMGRWWYYAKTVEGLAYGIQARSPLGAVEQSAGTRATHLPPALELGADVPGEQTLLDLNVLADGHEFFSLGSFDVSQDGNRLLYGVDTDGDERYTIRVRQIASGTDLSEEIAGTAAGALFDVTGDYIFYTTVDDSWRPDRVWRHRIGSDPTEDVVVFHEPDDRYWVGVSMTRSRRFLRIDLGSKITSETWLLPADDPTGEFFVVRAREEGVEYTAEHVIIPAAPGAPGAPGDLTPAGGVADAPSGSGSTLVHDGAAGTAGRDCLVIVHNGPVSGAADGETAVNFEAVCTPLPAPGRPVDLAAATVVIPHDPARRLEDIDSFDGFVAVSYRENALTRVAVVTVSPGCDTRTWPIEPVEFAEPLYAVSLDANPEFDQTSLRLTYTSFITPAQVIDLDVSSGELTVLKQQPVPGGYDPSQYVQAREWAPAADGMAIPISIVYRRDVVVRPAPMLLYGYGSYEISIDPAFRVSRLSLLDRGAVFAVAHVRGGGELGRTWYEQGRREFKRNTFTDFVDCASYLIEEGWTAPQRLVASGGSAGGLLMGAVANLAPRLFSGIVADVPFVDPLTSILDPELPLTVIEWDEWGDPLHNAEVYEYMRSYSPYENVADGVAYPPILAITSLNDTRVLYVEPAKWVARLRDAGADPLLKIEMAAGHGGVSGRYEQWREVAFEYAWVLDRLGLADVPVVAAAATTTDGVA